MKKNFIISLITIVWSACTPGNQQADEGSADSLSNDTMYMDMPVSLEELWATDTVMMTPESVIFDQDRDILYVANIGGTPPDSLDGDGFISKLSLNGEVIERQWVKGLNAPKGMGIFENTLYVTDVDKLVAINIEDGTVVANYPVEGAAFLNDVTVSPDGTVYFTGTAGAAIHQLKEGQLSTLMQGESLNRPNGLFYEPDFLLIASSGDGSVKKVSFADNSVELLAEGIGAGDGIVSDGAGNYLVSNWRGGLYFLSSDWELTRLLDTEGEMNTADIEYVASQNLLLVPTFYDNRVVAYKVNKNDAM